MATDVVVGKDAGAYYSTGTYATPVWVEIKGAMDVSVNLGKNTAEVASREISWSLVAPGLKTASVEVGYLHSNAADPVFDALLDMYIADTVTDMFFSDDNGTPNAGDQGLRAHFICTDMSQDQELEGAIQYTFTFEPTRFDDSGTLRNPEWYEIT